MKVSISGKEFDDTAEFSRATAAKLLGVSPEGLRQLPIRFRQYAKGGKAVYFAKDLSEFEEKSWKMGGEDE